MTVRTISPSGDVSGVTDTATVAAAVALMGAGDELIFATDPLKQWYFLPTGSTFIINANANNQTFTFGTSTVYKCYLNLVGKGAATTDLGIMKVSGFTGVTIQGLTDSAGNPMARLDGGRAAIVAANNGGEMTGGCVLVANQATWGSDNAIVIKNMELKDGFLNGLQLNSLQGATITNIISWATSSATDNNSNPLGGGGHGNDVDAVARGKPTKNVSFVNCDLDAYAAECHKLENAVNLTYTGCIFRNVLTLGQDNADAYDELGPLTFTNCTFYGLVQHQKMKRKGIAATNTPAADLSLSTASLGAVTVTASAGVFAAGDLNKYIAAIGSSGTLGFIQITGVAGVPTVVTGTNIQTWTGTTKATDSHLGSGFWTLGTVDQSGSGAVTFSGCTFAGDAAVAWGKDPIVANYGTLTFTNCTAYDDDKVVGGSNLRVFPAGVTFVDSGNTGLRGNVLHYVKGKPPAKVFSGYYASGSINGVYSYPGAWSCAQDINTACTSGLSSAGDEVVVMDGTYWSVAGTNDETNSYTTTGNKSLTPNGVAITIRAKHKWKAILDGTGVVSASNPFVDNSNTQGAEVRGFKIANWTAGNNIGVSIPAGTSSLRVRDVWFYNITNTNGGAAIRSVSTGAPVVENCLFTLCSTTGTGGGAIYTTSVNIRLTNLYFDACSTSVQMGGAARLDFATTATFPVVGIVCVNCSATGSANGGGIGGRNFTIINYSAANNTSVAATPAADLYSTGGTIVLKNSVLRSPTPISTNAGATLQYSFNDYAAAPTGGGTNTDQGNNVTTDPLLFGVIGGAGYNFRIRSTSSPAYRTGTFVVASLDFDGMERANPPSMGAYEFASPRTAASVRTAATTRTAALVRAPRFYP